MKNVKICSLLPFRKKYVKNECVLKGQAKQHQQKQNKTKKPNKTKNKQKTKKQKTKERKKEAFRLNILSSRQRADGHPT